MFQTKIEEQADVAIHAVFVIILIQLIHNLFRKLQSEALELKPDRK